MSFGGPPGEAALCCLAGCLAGRPVKPPPFDYVAARTADEAVGLLAAAGGGAQVLAGGQSLMLELNFRTRRPSVLVDINRVAGFVGLDVAAGTGADQGQPAFALTDSPRLERHTFTAGASYRDRSAF